MNNDERIIKYLDGELKEDEKLLFEKDLSRSENLRKELAAYKKVLASIDEQKIIDVESTYFNNLVPKPLLLILLSNVTSGGKVFLNSARFFSIFSVRFNVFVFGCFEIESITDGLAFCDAYPILTAAPSLTSAISLTSTGLPFMVFTNDLPSSSIS